MPRLSFTTMATPEQSGAQAIQMAGKYGYQGVDIRIAETKGELKIDSSITEINGLRKVFDGEGIIPSSVLCYVQPKKLNHPIGTIFRRGFSGAWKSQIA